MPAPAVASIPDLNVDTLPLSLASYLLTDEQYPEHFIDLELLNGAKLPATRYEFIGLCYSKKINPAKVGMLPYAVAECRLRP